MNVTWLLVRSTGLVAFALLAGATVWGLLLSCGLLGRSAPRKGLTLSHESLSIAALLSTGAHMLFLHTDDYIRFGLRELLLPGASHWHPLAVAWGVAAFYAVTVVTITFYVRRWIGRRAWRGVHYASFGAFAAALIHGLAAGTDRNHPVIVAMYAVCATSVIALVVVRLVRASSPTNKDAGGLSIHPVPAAASGFAPTPTGELPSATWIKTSPPP